MPEERPAAPGHAGGPELGDATATHRVVTNFAAEAADRTSEDIVRELVGGKAWLGT
jgi:hypothetical protein